MDNQTPTPNQPVAPPSASPAVSETTVIQAPVTPQGPVPQGKPLSTTLPPTPPTPPAENDPNKKLKIIGLIAVVFVVIAIIAFFVLPILLQPKPVQIEEPAPTVQIEPPPVASPAARSKFASDSGVLQIRDDLKRATISVDSVDLFEPQLTPPNIDSNIQVK